MTPDGMPETAEEFDEFDAACAAIDFDIDRRETYGVDGDALYTSRGGGRDPAPSEARLPASARPLAARVETGNFADDCMRLAEQIGDDQ